MLVDPETGKVVFITIDEIDPVTGELKVILPFLGAITLLDNSAVDEKSTHPNPFSRTVYHLSGNNPRTMKGRLIEC